MAALPRGRFRSRLLVSFLVFIVVSTCLAVIVISFPSLLLIPLGRFLVVQEEPAPSDAIVVLLGESGRERTTLAASLYQSSFAPILIFPETYHRTPIGAWGDVSEYPIEDGGADYRRRLIKAGVPASAIKTFQREGIHDTATELNADAEYLRELGARSVMLVSSASHSKRVSIIWRRVAPDIPARTIGAFDPQFDRWWRSRRRRRLVLYEYGALVKEALRRVKEAALGVFE